jgi:hypothetical protein
MSDMTRRRVLLLAATATGAGALTPACANADQRDEQQTGYATNERWEIERERVLAPGFTDAEAECWELVARAAGSFFALPPLHPMDEQEVAQAIHVIQNKLMSRPTYGRYLEAARRRGQ